MKKRLQRLEADREKLLEAGLRNMTNGELAELSIQAGINPQEYEWLSRYPDKRGTDDYDVSNMSDAELRAELLAVLPPDKGEDQPHQRGQAPRGQPGISQETE